MATVPFPRMILGRALGLKLAARARPTAVVMPPFTNAFEAFHVVSWAG